VGSPHAIEIKSDKEEMREMLSGLRWGKFGSRHLHPFDFGFGGGFCGEMGPGVAGSRKKALSSAEAAI